MLQSNLIDNLPQPDQDEIFEDIIKGDNVRIERIISKGQCSPDEHWYDQPQSEWVLVLQGHAKLLLQNSDHTQLPAKLVELKAGDHINIKAHQKHKVAWTCPDQITVWLAVFYD